MNASYRSRRGHSERFLPPARWRCSDRDVCSTRRVGGGVMAPSSRRLADRAVVCGAWRGSGGRRSCGSFAVGWMASRPRRRAVAAAPAASWSGAPGWGWLRCGGGLGLLRSPLHCQGWSRSETSLDQHFRRRLTRLARLGDALHSGPVTPASGLIRWPAATGRFWQPDQGPVAGGWTGLGLALQRCSDGDTFPVRRRHGEEPLNERASMSSSRPRAAADRSRGGW